MDPTKSRELFFHCLEAKGTLTMVAQPNAESRLLPVIFLGLSLKGGFGKGEGRFWARLPRRYRRWPNLLPTGLAWTTQCLLSLLFCQAIKEVLAMAELVPSRAHGGIFAFVEVACLPNYRGGLNNGQTCFLLGLWGHFNIC